MKKLTLFLLMLIPMKGISQAKIGYNPSELRAEFPSANWTYSKWGEYGNQNMVMSWSSENILTNYFFNEDNITIICTIVPLNQSTLQAVVEIYNKRYVIIDSNTWRFYSDGTIFLCRLKTLEDGTFYFAWTEQQ